MPLFLVIHSLHDSPDDWSSQENRQKGSTEFLGPPFYLLASAIE